MIKNLIRKVVSRLGIKSNRKILIFTSDDWGGIRLSSPSSQIELIKKNIINCDNRFERYDTLESNKDLEGLYDVLLKHKDQNGKNPVITALCNVANPNFEQIKKSGFEKYFLEPFTKTLERYPDSDKVYKYYLDGIDKNIFVPEFHGREHVQIHWWLENLRINDSLARVAFEHNYFHIHPNKIELPKGFGIGAAFDFWNLSELGEQQEIIESGLDLFSQLMGYKAKLFTPPAMIMHQSLEPILRKNDVTWLDKPLWELMPKGQGRVKNKINWTGKIRKHGIKTLVRNAVFEPNINQNNDGVDLCMSQIETAFKHKSLAIISNHRASFVGGIDPSNRDKGLLAIDSLFKKILQTWPDVEFVPVRDLESIL